MKAGFQPGKPRPENAGRKKGSVNKINKEVKDMIRGALDDAGGQKYLAAQAIENPKAFLTLLGRILPKNIEANINQNVTINQERIDNTVKWIDGLIIDQKRETNNINKLQ
jgi:hypothetical protein